MVDGTARDELAASEARYRSLVAALAHGVWSSDLDGRLIGDMPAWRGWTGQTRDELAGLGWIDVVLLEDRERVLATFARAVAELAPFEMEYRIRPLPGRGVPDHIRTLAARGVPVETDAPVGEYVGVFSDVTEQRATEAAREQLSGLAAAAAERTRSLQEVASALSSAVTLSDVLAVILAQGELRLGADASGVALRHGEWVRYELLRGYSADIRADWSEWSMDEESPVTHVIRTGVPMFVGSRDELPGFATSERLRRFVETSNEHAWARLPLRTPSGVLGALMFGFGRRRTFTEDERNFALALTGQCAQAIERAQLYERERARTRQLQSSLLPVALPRLDGVSLSAVCRPATEDVEVGGDWYDAVVLADGRLAVAVGDVMGRGVRAASVMGQVRNALRGLLHADPSPSAVLGWLDSVVAGLGDDEELVTLVYGIFDPASGEFTWGSAGHMPVLRLGDRASDYVDGGESLPLGLGGERPVGRTVVEPGEALVLFSDGLVESRSRSLTEGLALLGERAALLTEEGAMPEADVVRDQLIVDMLDPADADDVTLLLLRRPLHGPTDHARTSEVVLPCRASSAGVARAFVDSRLGEWEVTHLRDVVLLCVSEVVTNAVVHAASHADLSLRLAEGVLRVEVRDNGRMSMPSRPQRALWDDTHGRGLMLVDALSARWGSIDEPDGKVVWFEARV